MKNRIIGWSVTGICVAVAWTTYAFVSAPDYEIGLNAVERAIWRIAVITCPIILSGARFYWVIPINGATYAFIGLMVDRLRRHPQRTLL